MFNHIILRQGVNEDDGTFTARVDQWKMGNMNSTPIGAGVGADGRAVIIYTSWVAEGRKTPAGMLPEEDIIIISEPMNSKPN